MKSATSLTQYTQAFSLIFAAMPCALAQTTAPEPGAAPAVQHFYLALETKAGSSHYQLFLPKEFYLRGGDDRGHGLRIVNADKQAVPFALVAPHALIEQERQWQNLSFFALPSPSTATNGADKTDLLIAIDGALIWRNSGRKNENSAPAQSPPMTANTLLVDAHQQTKPMHKLALHWPDNVDDFISSVMVEYSDDLQLWRSDHGPQAIAVLRQRAAAEPELPMQTPATTDVANVNAANKVPTVASLYRSELLAPKTRAAYYRIRVLDAQSLPLPNQIRAETHYQTRQTWPSLNAETTASADESHPAALTFDLQAAVPVQRLLFTLPIDNQVIPISLYSANNYTDAYKTRQNSQHRHLTNPLRHHHEHAWPRLPWQWQTQAVLYRFNGAELSASPAIEVNNIRARFWRLINQQKPPIWPAEPVHLRYEWQPALIVFAAMGKAPYQMQWSTPATEAEASTALSASTLIPNYDSTQLPTFAQAQLGAVQEVAVNTNVQSEQEQARWILWAALGGGVLLLTAMVWRLRGELR